MAAGRGRGGASRAGSNHPALACASAALPCPGRGLLVVHLCRMFGACRWLRREALVIRFWFGPLSFHTAPRVRFFNSGSK